MNCTETEKVHRYRVKTTNGKTKVVRLWLSEMGSVCIMGKGKKTRGHYLNSGYYQETQDWVSLVPCSEDVNYLKRTIQRARKTREILAKSGLWEEIREEIEAFLELPQEQIEEFVKDAREDFYELVYMEIRKFGEGKYPWLSTYQVFDTIVNSKRCFKSPKIDRHRSFIKKDISTAIESKTNYHSRWTNGYDNTISVEVCKDGKFRGWYSEEYRQCGNGHYYLLFDATHAIFYEDD
jgi:hypothetical protein